MDILALSDTGSEGTFVNHVESGSWIERYREGGEFSFVGTEVDLLRESLPLDKLVSHSKTGEIMIVEDHLIEETPDEGPTITITGRSLEQVILENRVITVNGAGAATGGTGDLAAYGGGDYEFGFAFSGRGYSKSTTPGWEIATQVIDQYAIDSIENALDNVANLGVSSLVSGADSPVIYWRWDNFETIYEVIQDVLAYPRDLGIRVERPNSAHTTMDFVIHEGEDLSESVQFSWFLGDIKNARYLWSNREYKNAYFVYDETATRHLYANASKSGIHRRTSKVSVPDEKSNWTLPLQPILSDPPTGAEIGTNVTVFDDLAWVSIRANRKKTIVDAEIVEDARYSYKTDYNIGDIIMILGKYDISTQLRISEYAITFDDQGESGYPTLAAIQELDPP